MSKKYTALQIESYLEGKMSPEDAAAFENEMRSDPALRQETELQEQIIDGIRESRRLELKARLDALKLPTAWHGTTYLAAMVGGVIILGVGLSIYLATDNVRKQQSDQKAAEIVVTAPSEPTVTDEETMVAEDNTETEEVAIEIEPKQKAVASSPINEPVKPRPAQPTIPEDDETIVKDGSAGQAEVKEVQRAGSLRMTEVRVNKASSHKFDYELAENKLTLYGDFAADTYEVLELNTAKDKDLYLKYEDNYYALSHTKGQIKPLHQIKDQTKISELNKLSTRKP